MKLLPKDIEMFEQAREHIDTIIVPLAGIDFGTNMKQYARMNEFLTILASEIERQFKGRIILLPALSYIASLDTESRKQTALEWKVNFLNEGFKHVFFVTCDSDWKAVEKDFDQSLIWVPAIPLEGLDDSYKRQMMDEQVRQISNIFSQKWQQAK
ncbi:hypothetical protein JOC77_002064 [Peribacillus deserti]|uniref:DUF2487 domain-containing protein n=1 Tax=Peribacillus deserti TaxID=673318 RepID=A0ABS2QHL4_9BACI|nr:YpiF family protein [Peribacillus deserti]MBM7692634.1 hypothetical protein [Peribacillus deserti]